MKYALLTIMLLIGAAVACAQATNETADQKDDLQLHITPNPEAGEVLISWTMKQSAEVVLSISDTESCMTLTMYLGEISQSRFTKPVFVEAFTAGNYVVALTVDGQTFIKTFNIQQD